MDAPPPPPPLLLMSAADDSAGQEGCISQYKLQHTGFPGQFAKAASLFAMQPPGSDPGTDLECCLQLLTR